MEDLFEISSDVFNETSESGSVMFSAENIRPCLESIPIPAFVADGRHVVVEANAAACELIHFRHRDMVGKNVAAILKSTEVLDQLFQRITTEKPTKADVELVRSDKSLIQCEIFVKLLPDGRRLVLINDLSARKQAELSALESEKQRQRIKKTEVLERLAGGIAHDFNNLLAVIVLHTDMLNLEAVDNRSLLKRVNEIKSVSNDAAGIVRQLLAFAQKQKLNPTPVVINRMIENSMRPIQAMVGERIYVNFDLDPDLGVCFVDQNQISQALMYLVINAKDAIADNGTLKIRTENVFLERATTHSSQSGGSYVQISVADSGSGMDPKIKSRIFDPFFSTKEGDRGAGLGLATVYGTVKQSGGFIWVDSKVGSGTTFTIQFPRVDEVDAIEPKLNTVERLVAENETILLVEDDRAVRGVAAEILRNAGFRVLEAGSGAEAVKTAETVRPIHLILTDSSMPQMDGRTTAHRVRQKHPAVRVLFMSGKESDAQKLADQENGSFIGKPFSSAALVKKVREVLN